jgi:hypothetical protein
MLDQEEALKDIFSLLFKIETSVLKTWSDFSIMGLKQVS